MGVLDKYVYASVSLPLFMSCSKAIYILHTSKLIHPQPFLWKRKGVILLFIVRVGGFQMVALGRCLALIVAVILLSLAGCGLLAEVSIEATGMPSASTGRPA